MPATTLTMELGDFSQAMRDTYGLNQPSYTVQVITEKEGNKEHLAGFAFTGTGFYIMHTQDNEADMLAAFMCAQLREKPQAKTTRENIALPDNNSRYRSGDSTLNRFG